MYSSDDFQRDFQPLLAKRPAADLNHGPHRTIALFESRDFELQVWVDQGLATYSFELFRSWTASRKPVEPLFGIFFQRSRGRAQLIPVILDHDGHEVPFSPDLLAVGRGAVSKLTTLQELNLQSADIARLGTGNLRDICDFTPAPRRRSTLRGPVRVSTDGNLIRPDHWKL